MNLLIFLDFNLYITRAKMSNFAFFKGKMSNFFLFFTYNQVKIFLILPITRGGTCIPSLHWELRPPPDVTCKNKRAIFTHSISFTDPFNA